MSAAVMSTSQRQKFKDAQEVDLAYSVPGLGRFRCNVFQQRGTVGLVLRVIPMSIRTIEELGLPPVLHKIGDEERGLVLVTGTTGSGKSTTLAAMIDHINRSRCSHVMTVEDPIEFLHRDYRSIINQREVSVDTRSFAQALRSALRQDPDVILVGEMRDFETIETGLLAAETGHLVLSTLHTLDATETINRIIAVFPPHQQKQVRLQLASVLKAVISQRLMPSIDGMSRAPAVEVMISTPFIRDCIVDKERTHLIPGAIAAGTSQYGMQSFDQSIFGLYRSGRVSCLRRGAPLGVERRRVQAEGARHLDDRRVEPRSDGWRRHGPAASRRSPGLVPSDDEVRSAYLAGLTMLARRELSEAQVRQRLLRKKHSPEAIDAAITRLKSERAIDDAGWRRLWRAPKSACGDEVDCASSAASRTPASQAATARHAVEQVFETSTATRC